MGQDPRPACKADPERHIKQFDTWRAAKDHQFNLVRSGADATICEMGQDGCVCKPRRKAWLSDTLIPGWNPSSMAEFYRIFAETEVPGILAALGFAFLSIGIFAGSTTTVYVIGVGLAILALLTALAFAHPMLVRTVSTNGRGEQESLLPDSPADRNPQRCAARAGVRTLK